MVGGVDKVKSRGTLCRSWLRCAQVPVLTQNNVCFGEKSREARLGAGESHGKKIGKLYLAFSRLRPKATI